MSSLRPGYRVEKFMSALRRADADRDLKIGVAVAIRHSYVSAFGVSRGGCMMLMTIIIIIWRQIRGTAALTKA